MKVSLNLQAALLGALRNAERRAVLNAGKRKLRPGSDRLNIIKEGAETEIETVYIAGTQHARVVCEKEVRVVDAGLTL